MGMMRIVKFIWLHFLMLSFSFGSCSTVYADRNNAQSINTSSIRPDNSIINQKTYMDTSANGIPVVNINNPNESGISHNKFVDYNVGSRGVILNNSKDLAVSKIGGVVEGNSNLQNSARAIINEVTGTGRSHINGPQEILGQKADYILANPNGISINGGDLINAHRAILTTGRIELDAMGNLSKLLLNKGEVEIFGKELDVSGLDHFDIISRTAKINAKIHAGKQAKIITGKGKYDVKNDSFKSDNTSDPSLSIAIDSSHLGGLYAGRIKLESNENGVGVNAPDLASSMDNIEITASGKLIHRNINSASKLNIRSKDSSIKASSNAQVNASRGITYNAQGKIKISDSVVISGAGGIDINSLGADISNAGKIIANDTNNIRIIAGEFKNIGDIYALYGIVNVISNNNIINNGNILSGTALNIRGEDNFINTGILSSKSGVEINLKRSLKNQDGGMIVTPGKVITASEEFNNTGEIVSTDLVKIKTSKDLTNTGSIIGINEVSLFSGAEVTNSGDVVSDKKIVLDAKGDIVNVGSNKKINAQIVNINSKDGKLMNSALIDAGDILNITTDKELINTQSGMIQSENLILTSDNSGIDNVGNIFATSSITLKVKDDIYNVGNIIQDERVLEADINDLSRYKNLVNLAEANHPAAQQLLDGTIDTSNTGRNVDRSLNIDANEGRLENEGIIYSSGDITINTGRAIENIEGKIIGEKDIKLIVQESKLNNTGEIIARGDISLSVFDITDNSGLLESRGSLTLDGGGMLNNLGEIISYNELTINSRGKVKNGDQGVINALGRLSILSLEKIVNSGKIEGFDSVNLESEGIKNNGQVKSVLELDIDSRSEIENFGLLKTTQGKINVSAIGNIKNIDGGIIDSAGYLTIKSRNGTIENIKTDVNQREESRILGRLGATLKSALDIENKSSKIDVSDNLKLKTKGNFVNDSGLVVADNITLHIDVNITNNIGIIQSDNKMHITSSGILDNSGNILGKVEVNVDVLGNIQNKGNINSEGKLEIISDAGEIINSGTIYSKNKSKLEAELNISNKDSGKIESHGDLFIFSNSGSLINTNSDPSIYSEGGIIGHANLLIAAKKSIDNKAGHIESLGTMSIAGVSGVNNEKGNIISGNQLSIITDEEVLNYGSIQAKDKLTIAGINSKDSTAKTLINTGFISSKGNIDFKLQENSKNTGILQAEGNLDISINTGELENLGTILSSQENVHLNVHEAITNKKYGVIDASKSISLVSNSGAINNVGRVYSASEMVNLEAKSGISNEGNIIAKEAIHLTAEEGEIENLPLAQIASLTGGIIIHSGQKITNSGLLQASNKIDIQAGDGNNNIFSNFENNEGNIVAGDEITIKAENIDNILNEHNQTNIKGNIQAKLIKLDATQSVNNPGIINADTLSITAENTVSNLGTIQAKGGNIVSKKGNINNDNNGAIYFSQNLTLDAAQNIINKGNIEVDDLTLKAETINNQKQIKANTRLIINDAKIQLLENNGLIEFGELKALITGDIDNKANATFKGNELNIEADNFTNSGTINLDGKLDINVKNNLTSNILLAKGKSVIKVGGRFSNHGRLHLLGSNSSLEADTITNNGEFKAGDLKLITNGNLDNQGMLFATNNLDIEAFGDVTNGDYIISGGGVKINASGAITNNKGIYGKTSVGITKAATLKNNVSGSIKSSGNVTITAGNTSNSGTLAGRNALIVNGALTNNGTAISHGNLKVSAVGQSIYNSGNITSHSNADLISYDLTNHGTLQAVNVFKSTQSGNITNYSSIYGGTVNLSTGGSFTNNNRIIANNNLRIVSSGNVTNKSQISLLGRGSLSIKAANLENRRNYSATFFNKNDFIGVNSQVKPTIKPTSEKYEYLHRYQENYFPFGPKKYDPMPFHGEKELFRNTYIYSFSDKLNSLENITPLITSNGSININAVNINNILGNITARDNVNISGSNLKNQDVVVKEHNLERIESLYLLPWWKKGRFMGMSWPSRRPVTKQEWISDKVIKRVPSLIQAGGGISGNLSGSVSNGSSESGGGKSVHSASGSMVGAYQTDYTSGTSEPGEIVVGSSSFINHPRKASIPQTTNMIGELTAFTGHALGMQRMSTASIATRRIRQRNIDSVTPEVSFTNVAMANADFRNLARNIASSYKSSSTISSSDIDWKFDDPEIMAAISNANWDKPASPGNYYIVETSPVFTDVNKYFSTDNFIKRLDNFDPKKHHTHYGDSMKQMDLVQRQVVELSGLGSLDDNLSSTQQMQKLYDTGVAYGNKMQLTPGVSLSKELVEQLQEDMVWAEEVVLDGTKVLAPKLYLAKNKRSEQVGGILAQNINIVADSIGNESSIVGNNVSLLARNGNISNVGGGDIYGVNINIEADNIGNESSIAGNNVSLLARNGNISNVKGGDIYALNYLGLSATGNVHNIGSVIGSSGHGEIIVGGNIENITETKRYGGDRNHTTEVGTKSSINVKGPLAFRTGGDLLNKGSNIESGDLNFYIGGNLINNSIAVSEAVDNTGSNYHYRKSSVSYLPSMINATGNVSGMVAGDFTILGSRLNAGGDSEIEVGGNSYIVSQVSSQMLDTYSSSKTRGVLGSTKHESAHQSRKDSLVEAGISAGGKNELVNSGDQILYAAKLHGEDGVNLKAKNIKMEAIGLEDNRSDYSYDEGLLMDDIGNSGYKSTNYATTSLSGNGNHKIESDHIDLSYKQGEKASWSRHLEGNNGVKWNPLKDSSEFWDESETHLNARGTALVSLAAGVATSWAGGWGFFAKEGASFTVGQVMGQAAATGIAAQGSVSMINNGFDPFKVAKDLTSPEALKSLAVSMATAGLTHGIASKLDIPQVDGHMGKTERFATMAKHGAVSTGVRVGLSGISGEKAENIIKSEALLTTLAAGQSVIGDIGVGYGLEDGSVAKVAMHGGLGAAYGAATGDIAGGTMGGVVGEIMPTLLAKNGMVSGSGNTGPPIGNGSAKAEVERKIKDITRLTAGVATFLTGGSAKSINNSSKVATSVVENNDNLHKEERLVLERVLDGKTEEERQEYYGTALNAVNAMATVNPNKDSKKSVAMLKSLIAKSDEKKLVELKKVGANLGYEGVFERGYLSEAKDNIIKYGKFERIRGVTKIYQSAANLDTTGIVDGTSSLLNLPISETYKALTSSDNSGVDKMIALMIALSPSDYNAIGYGEADRILQSLHSPVSSPILTTLDHAQEEFSLTTSEVILGGAFLKVGGKLGKVAINTKAGQYAVGKVGELGSYVGSTIVNTAIASKDRVLQVVPKTITDGTVSAGSNAHLAIHQQKAIRSLEKQIIKHQEKLKEFKNNPTVRPGMENLAQEITDMQQKLRIKHLETEINTFKNNIEKIKRGDLNS